MLFGIVQGLYQHAFDDHVTLIAQLCSGYLVYALCHQDIQRCRYFMRKAMCDSG